MEKFTELNGMGEFELKCCFECGSGAGANNENCGLCEKQQPALQRLGEYENTDLTPEEIVEMNNFAHSQSAKLLIDNSKLKRVLEIAKSNMAYIATTRNICAVCRYGCKEQRVHCAKFEWCWSQQPMEALKHD